MMKIKATITIEERRNRISMGLKIFFPSFQLIKSVLLNVLSYLSSNHTPIPAVKRMSIRGIFHGLNATKRGNMIYRIANSTMKPIFDE